MLNSVSAWSRALDWSDRDKMGSNTAIGGWHGGAWDMVVRLGDADGSAAHAHLHRLAHDAPAQRNLSDAVHALCAIHGHHPGMIAETLGRSAQPDAREWLEAADAGFTDERAFLAQLTAAVGPLPSTPGQAETEATLAGQRHALEMLARSDRSGCATGAIAALLHDWIAIRGVLDVAARRFAVDVPPVTLPPVEDNATIVAMLGDTPACERAIAFGAQQLFAQHRGFWSLLESRASARGDI